MVDPQESIKFNSLTIQASSGPSCKENNANKAQQIKVDNADINNANTDMPHYFRSSLNKAADKGVCQALTHKLK